MRPEARSPDDLFLGNGLSAIARDDHGLLSEYPQCFQVLLDVSTIFS